MSDIPQEFTREQFVERGIWVTPGEIRAVNQNVYMIEKAFREQEVGEAGPAWSSSPQRPGPDPPLDLGSLTTRQLVKGANHPARNRRAKTPRGALDAQRKGL